MSSNVDKRIVSMQIDKDQFQQGIASSVKSLDNLKKALELSDSMKNMKHVTSVMNGLNFGAITSGVGAAANSFSAFGAIGFTVLQNLTNSVINLGSRLASDLVLNPLKSGLGEYETNMNAIQVIMANTATKGTSLDQVKGSLLELNDYADKTIYVFSQMADAVSKATGAGLDIDKATSSVKGFANIAAIAGANAERMAASQYQVNQGLSRGYIRLEEWNSMSQANMTGTFLQDAIKRTAKAHGIQIDAMIAREGNLQMTLHSGWLTTSLWAETMATMTGDMTKDQLKSMNYTDAQIVEIQKASEIAKKAATEVKTATQFFGTLNELASSGWAKTMEIVIGDFEASKTMWTNASNAFGSIITNADDARNNLLKGWSDMGGRQALIYGLGFAFDALKEVIGVVSEAFAEIFPPMTVQQLFDLTNGFRNFALTLNQSPQNLEKIKMAFKGFFAIFDIAGKFIGAAAEALYKFAGTKVSAGGILDFAANLGKSVTEFRDWAIQSDYFNKKVAEIGDWLRQAKNDTIDFAKAAKKKLEEAQEAYKTFVANVLEAIQSMKAKYTEIMGAISTNPALLGVINTLRMFGSTVKEIFEGFTEVSTDAFGGLIARVTGRLEPLKAVTEATKKSTNEMKAAVASQPSFMEQAIAKAGEVLAWCGGIAGKIFAAIVKGIENIDWNTFSFDKMFDGVNAGMLIGLGISVTNFVNKGSTIFDPIKNMFQSADNVVVKAGGFVSSLSGVLDGVKTSMEAWQSSLRADYIQKIAIAMLILTGSLIALSLVDSVKLLGAMGAMSGMFAEMMGAIVVINKAFAGAGLATMEKAAIGLVGLSVSMAIMAGALTIVAAIPGDKVASATWNMEFMIMTLTGAAIALSKNSSGMLEAGLALMAVSRAVEVVAGAAIQMAAIDPLALFKGIAAIGVLFIIMKAYSAFGQGTEKISKDNGINMLLMASAVKQLGKVAEELGLIDDGKLMKGVVAVGAILAVVGAFNVSTAQVGNALSMSIGLVVIAGGMQIMAGAVERLGNMDQEKVGIAVLAFAGIFSEIALMLKAIDPATALSKAMAVLLVSAALGLVALSLLAFANMSWEQIGKAMLTFTVVMATLTIALNVLANNPGVAGAAVAIVLTAYALGMLVPVLEKMGKMSIQEIFFSLTMLAGVFGILAIAGMVLGPMVPVLAGLGATLILFGIACASVGAGVMMLAIGMGMLAVSGVAGSIAMVGMLGSLLSILPMIVTAVVGAVILWAKLIAEAAPLLKAAFKILFMSFIELLIEIQPVVLTQLTLFLLELIRNIVLLVPAFVEGVYKIIDAVLKSMATHIPSFLEAGYKILLAFLKAFRDNIPGLVAVTLEIMQAIIGAFIGEIPKIVDAGFKMIIDLIDGISRAIDENAEAVGEATAKLGVAIVQGVIKGVEGMNSELARQIVKMARQALADLIKIWESHSPSEAFARIGEFVPQGAALGIDRESGVLTKSVTAMGQDSLTVMKRAMSDIATLVTNNMDMAPTLRPVVDLDGVRASAAQIDGILGNKTIKMLTTADRLVGIKMGVDSSKELALGNSNQPAVGGTNVTLTQNNYSPEALSAFEIYRQTRNQMTLLKGLVGA